MRVPIELQARPLTNAHRLSIASSLVNRNGTQYLYSFFFAFHLCIKFHGCLFGKPLCGRETQMSRCIVFQIRNIRELQQYSRIEKTGFRLTKYGVTTTRMGQVNDNVMRIHAAEHLMTMTVMIAASYFV